MSTGGSHFNQDEQQALRIGILRASNRLRDIQQSAMEDGHKGNQLGVIIAFRLIEFINKIGKAQTNTDVQNIFTEMKSNPFLQTEQEALDKVLKEFEGELAKSAATNTTPTAATGKAPPRPTKPPPILFENPQASNPHASNPQKSTWLQGKLSPKDQMERDLDALVKQASNYRISKWEDMLNSALSAVLTARVNKTEMNEALTILNNLMNLNAPPPIKEKVKALLENPIMKQAQQLIDAQQKDKKSGPRAE
ncbi:MAG: hypothetical protein ACHQJ6_03760 [Candidatus Berkiellales bacterium]